MSPQPRSAKRPDTPADTIRRFSRSHPDHPLRVFEIAQRTKRLIRCEACGSATVVKRRLGT